MRPLLVLLVAAAGCRSSAPAARPGDPGRVPTGYVHPACEAEPAAPPRPAADPGPEALAKLDAAVRAVDYGEAQRLSAALGPAAVPELVRLSAHEDGDARLLAVHCLALAGGGPEAERAWVERLTDRDEQVGGAAMTELERTAGAGAAPLLVRAYPAAAAWLRLRIVKLAARLGGAAVAADVGALCAAERDPEALPGCTVALAGLGDAAARARFAEALRAAEGDALVELLLDARTLRQPWLVPALAPLLDDTTDAVFASEGERVDGATEVTYRRVCDLAVDAIAAITCHRFSFDLRAVNYGPEQLAEVRRLAAAPPAADPVACYAPGLESAVVVLARDFATGAPVAGAVVTASHQVVCTQEGCESTHPHDDALLVLRAPSGADGTVVFCVPDLDYKVETHRHGHPDYLDPTFSTYALRLAGDGELVKPVSRDEQTATYQARFVSRAHLEATSVVTTRDQAVAAAERALGGCNLAGLQLDVDDNQGNWQVDVMRDPRTYFATVIVESGDGSTRVTRCFDACCRGR